MPKPPETRLTTRPWKQTEREREKKSVEWRQTKVSHDSSWGWKLAVTREDFGRPSAEKERGRARWGRCKTGDFRASKRDDPIVVVLQQPTARMHYASRGKWTDVKCLSRGHAASVNLMRPAQKEREPTDEWPNERCASELEISQKRFRALPPRSNAPICRASIDSDSEAYSAPPRFCSLRSETNKKSEILGQRRSRICFAIWEISEWIWRIKSASLIFISRRTSL